jgi:lipoyl(octanoyl) transferase
MISVVQLGTVDYATGLRLQHKLVELRKANQIGDVLLLLEHSPVITLGRNAKAANVVASPARLKRREVEVFECDRGGDVTFHGPGQLVGYPIFDLRAATTPAGERKTLGAVEFVRRLEEVLIRTCADFGIPAKRVGGLTGVWTNPPSWSSPAQPSDLLLGDRRHPDRDGSPEQPEAKIAAIGVHISRAVTSHGFALNVNTDLSYFDLIIPCGISAKAVTSMSKEAGRDLDLNQVAKSVSRNFGLVFCSQVLWVQTLDALLGNAVGVPAKPPAEFRELHQREDDEITWA